MAVFEQPSYSWPWSFVGACIYDPPGEILLYYSDPDTNSMISECFQDTVEANEFVCDNGIKQYTIYRKIESDDEEYTSRHKFMTQPYWDVGSQIYKTDDDVDVGDTVYICFPEETGANVYQTREDAAQRLQELQSMPRSYKYLGKVYQATISS